MSDVQDAKAIDLAAEEASFEFRRIGCPHPDIELGVDRLPLEYLVRIPDAGLKPDTGLILFLTAYGMPPRGPYVRKLLSYLANKHNCLAASVDYFGAELWLGKSRFIPHPEFFVKLKEHYGIQVSAAKVETWEIAKRLWIWLAANGQRSLHPDCILMGVSSEYDSMRFLPALDGLRVVHRLIGDFALDKRRIFLLGSSYGGYIASIMVKFAPRTFRMAIENSGFSSAQDDIGNVYGSAPMRLPRQVAIRMQMVCAVSADPSAENFFSPARSRIRSLLEREIIDESKIDGRIFKELCHGMRASLRGLFDLSYAKFQRDGGALADGTDFDHESRYIFPRGEKNYTLQVFRGAMASGRRSSRRHSLLNLPRSSPLSPCRRAASG